MLDMHTITDLFRPSVTFQPAGIFRIRRPASRTLLHRGTKAALIEFCVMGTTDRPLRLREGTPGIRSICADWTSARHSIFGDH